MIIIMVVSYRKKKRGPKKKPNSGQNNRQLEKHGEGRDNQVRLPITKHLLSLNSAILMMNEEKDILMETKKKKKDWQKGRD